MEVAITVAPRTEMRGDEKQILERAVLKETAPCTCNFAGAVEKSATAGKKSFGAEGRSYTAPVGKWMEKRTAPQRTLAPEGTI